MNGGSFGLHLGRLASAEVAVVEGIQSNLISFLRTGGTCLFNVIQPDCFKYSISYYI